MGSAAVIGLTVSTVSQSHRRKEKKLALIFFPFPSLTLRDGFQMPGDLVPTLALWTATTFRQLKGSPLRTLPTTPPCRVHPCSRLFHRPPVSPTALPALPDLNSPAWQQVPAYPCTLVPKYPSTGARPGPFFPSSTQLMCVYFLLLLFFMSIFVHALTTDIIINPQFCKVQWVQEGGEGR